MAPLQRLAALVGPALFFRLVRMYPPFLGAGVRVRSAARDLSRIEVELRLTPWNQNYVGTLFGGSLYAMCDPFFALMLSMRLGPAYAVWDRSATIDFLRPGRGTVVAAFELPAARVEEVRREADQGEKVLPRFEVTVVDEEGLPVARVEKVLHVRRKGHATAAPEQGRRRPRAPGPARPGSHPRRRGRRAIHVRPRRG